MFLPLTNTVAPKEQPNPDPVRVVLGEQDSAESLGEVLERIETARKHHPSDRRLQEMEVLFRSMIEGTRDGANLLEKYGKETIIEILESIPVVSPEREPNDPPASERSESGHDPAVEDL